MAIRTECSVEPVAVLDSNALRIEREASTGWFSDSALTVQEAIDVDLALDSVDVEEPQGPYSRRASSIERLVAETTSRRVQVINADKPHPSNSSCERSSPTGTAVNCGDAVQRSMFTKADCGHIGQRGDRRKEPVLDPPAAKKPVSSFSMRSFRQRPGKLLAWLGMSCQVNKKHPHDNVHASANDPRSPRQGRSSRASQSAKIF